MPAKRKPEALHAPRGKIPRYDLVTGRFNPRDRARVRRAPTPEPEPVATPGPEAVANPEPTAPEFVDPDGAMHLKNHRDSLLHQLERQSQQVSALRTDFRKLYSSHKKAAERARGATAENLELRLRVSKLEAKELALRASLDRAFVYADKCYTNNGMLYTQAMHWRQEALRMSAVGALSNLKEE